MKNSVDIGAYLTQNISGRFDYHEPKPVTSALFYVLITHQSKRIEQTTYICTERCVPTGDFRRVLNKFGCGQICG